MTRCPRCGTREPLTVGRTGQQIAVPVRYGLFLSDPDSPARDLSTDENVLAVTLASELSATCLRCGLVLLGFAAGDHFHVHPATQVRELARTATPPRST